MSLTEYVKTNQVPWLEQPYLKVIAYAGKPASPIKKLTLHSASHLQITGTITVIQNFVLLVKNDEYLNEYLNFTLQILMSI